MKQITFDNIISNRLLDNNWRDMEHNERIEALEDIKDFLLSTCRRMSSETAHAIMRMNIDNLPPNIGIYRRLTTKEYIAGQDYPGELNFIKQQIKRYC